MAKITKKQAEIHAEMRALGIEPGNESLNDVERAWMNIQRRAGKNVDGYRAFRPSLSYLESISETFTA